MISLIWLDCQSYGTLVSDGYGCGHYDAFCERVGTRTFEESHRGYAHIDKKKKYIRLWLSPCVPSDLRYIPNSVVNYFVQNYKGYCIEKHAV